MFVKHTTPGIVILVVYVDDIIVSGGDTLAIKEVKSQLKKNFHTKDMGQLRYFLGIEVANGRHGLILSQRKYTQDLLSETGMLGSKPTESPMDLNTNLHDEESPNFEDNKR